MKMTSPLCIPYAVRDLRRQSLVVSIYMKALACSLNTSRSVHHPARTGVGTS
jgi:hypothetical protein